MKVNYVKICSILVFVASSSVTVRAEDCWKRASDKYGMPVELLHAIAKIESGFDPHAINLNHRSYDIGVMQVNSSWLPKLEKYGIKAEDLYDECTNIDVGAWILYNEVQRHGYNWKAVGYYHSPAPGYQSRYITRVANVLGGKR